MNDLTEEAQPYASSLRKYDLAYRVTFVSFLVSQVAGFVLLAIACQAPPPFHQLTGVYVCVGALFVCPVALCIINDRKDSFLKSVNLKEPTHLAVDSSSEEED
ncbi:MAG: hypothetical protein S4CHLAM81_06640 [Chlamydiales bacterium]|nr:hypothetical protein [Chlamydiales bacterium]MCH9635448.1 hypothetical protein [Chlamydiales bacterium]